MDAVVKDLCVNAWTTQGWYTTQPQDHVVIKDRCVNGNLAILVQSAWIEKNKNSIATGLRNMKASIFCYFVHRPQWLIPCLNTHISPSIAAMSCSALIISIAAMDTIRL